MPLPTVATNSDTGTAGDQIKSARRRDRRRARYEAREILWTESGVKRLRHCGRYSAGQSVQVKRFHDGSGAGFSGVQSCGSVWACPVCSEKVNAGRQSELAKALSAWSARGGHIVFGTLTVSHRAGTSLASLWDAISPAWNRTTSGAGVQWNGSKRAGGDKGDKATYGIKGYVRVTETTHGVNGWHPHIHFLLFVENRLTDQQMQALEGRMYARWSKALKNSGLRASRARGIDMRRVEGTSAPLADYFSKNTFTGEASIQQAAFEVTGAHGKKGRNGSRTPFQILADIVALGDEADVDLWHEWELASHGRRQLTWSRGLRDLLDLDEEATDQDLVEEDKGGDVVAVIAAPDYARLARAGLLVELLETAERPDAVVAVRALLDRWGCVPFIPPQVE